MLFFFGPHVSANFPQLVDQPPKPIAVDPTDEYVAGGDAWWSATVKELCDISEGRTSLPPEQADAMMRDPQVASSVGFLIESVFAEGIQALPAVKDKDPDYARAEEIANVWGAALGRACVLEKSKSMLTSAMGDGHKIAEAVWERRDGRLVIAKLGVKERGACRFVVDRFKNTVAIRGRNAAGGDVYFPPEKFAILTLGPIDDDPRGTKLIEPARVWWFLKAKVPPQYHRFLEELILPILLGFTAPGADKRPEQQLQADGTKKAVSAAQAMRDALAELRSKVCAVFPEGAKVDFVKNESSGEAFGTAVNDVIDRQINKAITLTDLSLREGQHQTRSATAEQMSATDLRILDLKRTVAGMLDSLGRRFVLYNWGESAEHLAPRHTLGDSERRDWAEDMNAISKAWTAGWAKLLDVPKMAAIVNVELADDWQERLEQMMAAPATEPVVDEDLDEKDDSDQEDDDDAE